MSHEFVGVSESDALLDAVELMRAENTTSAVVLRGNESVGLVTTGPSSTCSSTTHASPTPPYRTSCETRPNRSPDAVVADAANAMGRTGNPGCS